MEQSTHLHEMIEAINSQPDPHRFDSGPHNPDPGPEPKQTPNFGVSASTRLVTFPNGAVWIPNGRSDNPPPSISPEKWAALSRQARRAFAARVMNVR